MNLAAEQGRSARWHGRRAPVNGIVRDLLTLANAVVSMRSRSHARHAVDEALAGAWATSRDGGPRHRRAARTGTAGRGYADRTSGRRTPSSPEAVTPDPVKECPWISTPCSVTMPMAC